jgi:hypothetical protein
MGTFEKEPVDLAILRAELAVAKQRVVDLEHILRTHGAADVAHARTVLSGLLERVASAVGRILEGSALHAISQTFSLIDGQLASAQRVFEQASCQCGLNENITLTIEDRAALEARIEDAYLARPDAKVIRLRRLPGGAA